MFRALFFPDIRRKDKFISPIRIRRRFTGRFGVQEKILKKFYVSGYSAKQGRETLSKIFKKIFI
jgi:hypothetical protein